MKGNPTTVLITILILPYMILKWIYALIINLNLWANSTILDYHREMERGNNE